MYIKRYMYMATTSQHDYVYSKYCTFLHRGDSAVVQCGGVVATLWMDKKVVRALSTNFQPNDTGNVTRKLYDGSTISVLCPDAIIQYNRYMRGVDRNDQLRQYYHVRLRGRKYYKYIFWFLLDVSITNAYILFSNYANHEGSAVRCLKDF